MDSQLVGYVGRQLREPKGIPVALHTRPQRLTERLYALDCRIPGAQGVSTAASEGLKSRHQARCLAGSLHNKIPCSAHCESPVQSRLFSVCMYEERECGDVQMILHACPQYV
eukprot:1150577-Pelagomonas_calceolata.AAC.2